MGVFWRHRNGPRFVRNEFDGHADTVVQAAVINGDVVTQRVPSGLTGAADLLAAVVRRQWEAGDR